MASALEGLKDLCVLVLWTKVDSALEGLFKGSLHPCALEESSLSIRRVIKGSFLPCALDESSLSIGRVKGSLRLCALDESSLSIGRVKESLRLGALDESSLSIGMVKGSLHPCALDESSLSIGRFKESSRLVLWTKEALASEGLTCSSCITFKSRGYRTCLHSTSSFMPCFLRENRMED